MGVLFWTFISIGIGNPVRGKTSWRLLLHHWYWNSPFRLLLKQAMPWLRILWILQYDPEPLFLYQIQSWSDCLSYEKHFNPLKESILPGLFITNIKITYQLFWAHKLVTSIFNINYFTQMFLWPIFYGYRVQIIPTRFRSSTAKPKRLEKKCHIAHALLNNVCLYREQ